MKTAPVTRLPVSRFELRSGARLLVSRRPGAPVCAVQVHVRGGQSLDPAGLEGTAYLAGGLVDQGTADHDEEEIARLLEAEGGSLSGGASGITAGIAGQGWKLLCGLVAEAVSSPTYPRERFELQRKRLLDRLLVERDDPRLQAGRLFRRLVYGDHWLARPEQGTLESVARIRRAGVARFHRSHWCGARTLIAFSGDVDPDEVRRLFDRRLARWRRGSAIPVGPVRFPQLKPRTGVFRATRQQVHVYLGHLGVRRTDPDYPALVVMDHVLGTGPGFTSRIARRLRDELGLAYTVYASIGSSAGVLPGTFTAYIGTSPEHVRTAIRGFLREIRRIQREKVSREELELAKSYLTGSFPLGFERAARRVATLVAAERNGLADDHLERLLAEFRRVSADDVRRVARKHLHPDRAAIAASGPVTRKDLLP